MASSKDDMMNTANYYLNKVTDAKTACDSAAKCMISPQVDVESNWTGASGNAMAEALDSLHSDIIAAYTQLTVLESKMRNQAWSIYNNWPEESADE